MTLVRVGPSHGRAVVLCLAGALAAVAVGCAASKASDLSTSAASAEQARRPARLLNSAEVFAAAGDYVRAEQYFTLALQGGAEPHRVSVRLVEVCVSDGRYRAAVQYATRYLRDHPRDFRLRYVLSTLLNAVGQPQAASEELQKVLAAEPDHAPAHYSLAVLLRDSSGNHAAADRHFRDYLRLAPSGVHSEEAQQSLLEYVR